MSRGLRLRVVVPGAVAALEAKCDRGSRRAKRAPAPGTEQFELLLAFQMDASKLPKPERQVTFATGRKFAADFAWREYTLLVEVQGGIWRRGGGAHSHPSMILRDIEKAQLAVINGWSLFPVTTDQVTSGEALQLIEIALKTKGWKP